MGLASAPSAMEPAMTHFSPHSTANTNDKSTFHRKNDLCDVVIASVHSEITRLKKLLMMMTIIIIMNKSQETTVFSGCQKLTSAMKLWPEK